MLFEAQALGGRELRRDVDDRHDRYGSCEHAVIVLCRPRLLTAPGTLTLSVVPTIFSTKPQVRGRRVVLRPFTAADIDAMGPVLADPGVLRLTGNTHTSGVRPSPVLDDRNRTWYESWAEQDDRLDLAVVDAATDQCVGEVVLSEWEPDNRSHRAWRLCLQPASAARDERAGFVVEGRRRDGLLFDGTWVDEVLLAVLRPDWPARR